jgi:hypothetical protein
MIRRGCWMAVVGVFLLTPAAASAAPLTIGELAPGSNPSSVVCSGGPYDLLQYATSGAPGYAVPAGYTRLTSWSTNASSDASQLMKL